MAIPKELRGRFMSAGRKAKNGQRHPGRPLTKVVVSLHTQSLKEAQERGYLPDEFELDVEDLNDFQVVSHELSAVQRRTGITLDPDSETYRLLGRAIVRTVSDAMDGRLKALQGEPSQEPATFLGAHGIDKVSLRPIASLPRPKIRIRDDSSIRFSEAASLYMDQRQHDVNAALTEQTRSQQQAIFRLFEDYTDNALLTAIDR
jgi:hypothetical protein